ARARQRSRYLNGRIVDIRQIANRKHSVGHDAEQQNRRGDENGSNGTADKEFRNVHCEAPAALVPAVAGPALTISTGKLGPRRSWPSVTTVSPGAMPFEITISRPTARPTVTGRISTVWLGLTTKAYWPCWPV